MDTEAKEITLNDNEPKGQGSTPDADHPTTLFVRPAFIVSAPRSGSTLLFETLAGNQPLWTLGREGRREIEQIEALSIASRGFDSHRITAEMATPSVRIALKQNYLQCLKNPVHGLYRNAPTSLRRRLRFLEKTPLNGLRIPFFKAVFPDALFIYLHRSPRDNVSSMIDAWQSGKFVSYPRLPNWQCINHMSVPVPKLGKFFSLDVTFHGHTHGRAKCHRIRITFTATNGVI